MKKIKFIFILIFLIFLVFLMLGCGAEIVTLTITYNSDAFSSVTVDGELIAEETHWEAEIGDEVLLEATPESGYTFIGWHIETNSDDLGTNEPVSTQSSYTYTVEEDVYIYAEAHAPR
jgi:hypothetical protein